MRLHSLAILGLLAGCSLGKGEGAVVGAIEISGCAKNSDYDDPEFDLGADFFVGQPNFDPDEDDDVARDSLWIRVQHGGAYEELADTLSIHVIDLDKVREGVVEEVMADGCQRSKGKDGADDLPGCVRAELLMALSCPDAFENLVAAADLDVDGNPIPCPADVDLRRTFAGDFDDPEAFEDPFFSGDASDPDALHPSCIVFESLGAEYGDEIAAAFHFALRDARRLDGPSEVGGYLRGRFRFDLWRGAGAQAYP